MLTVLVVTRDEILEALKDVKDPEIPQVDIVNLGLVYDVRIGENGVVVVDMTFTSMACPAGAAFEEMVKGTVMSLPDVRDAFVNVVWDPPWSPQKATEEGKLILSTLGVRVD